MPCVVGKRRNGNFEFMLQNLAVLHNVKFVRLVFRRQTLQCAFVFGVGNCLDYQKVAAVYRAERMNKTALLLPHLIPRTVESLRVCVNVAVIQVAAQCDMYRQFAVVLI